MDQGLVEIEREGIGAEDAKNWVRLEKSVFNHPTFPL